MYPTRSAKRAPMLSRTGASNMNRNSHSLEIRFPMHPKPIPLQSPNSARQWCFPGLAAEKHRQYAEQGEARHDRRTLSETAEVADKQPSN